MPERSRLLFGELQILSLTRTSLRTKAIRALTPPPSQARNCVFMEGDSSEEKAENLALRLRGDRGDMNGQA